MPLNVNNVCGLDPLPDNTGNVNVRSMIPIDSDVNTDIPLFKGSPYVVSAGTVTGITWSTDPAFQCAGSVVKLYNANKVEVVNLPNATDGFADVAYEKDQRYQVLVGGITFSDDGSDNGTTFGLTDESATASTNGFDGSGVSFIKLDGNFKDPSTNTFIASFKVRKPGNLGGVDKTLVEGKINPVCHQAW